MNRNFVLAAVIALLPVSFAARASVDPPSATSVASRDTDASAQALVLKGYADLQSDDGTAARAHFEQAIKAADFILLPNQERYDVLLGTGLLELQYGDKHRAHALLVRATTFKDADGVAWINRLFSAFRIADYDDAARSITEVARRWPAKLDALLPGAAGMLHRHLRKEHHGDRDRRMLDALFDAGWPDEANGSNYLWRDLALMHLQRGETKRARQVALAIHLPRVVLSMRVDKRFDPITRVHPQAFDIDRLMAAQIKQARAQVAAHPHQLEPIERLQDLYLASGRFSQVIAVSEPVVAHVAKGEGDSTYSDFGDKYNWILDERARALGFQGQWDRAVRERVRAARVPEHGSMNVSQSINLGVLYANLGKPDEAADAIAQIGNVSPYGRMQLEDVKLRVAIDRHDKAAIARHMAFIRKHREDALVTWQSALLLHGDLDRAAALLIERLKKPAWRNEALAEMQHYDVPIHRTPLEQREHERMQAVIARPEVQAALHKVGRVEHVHLTPAQH